MSIKKSNILSKSSSSFSLKEKNTNTNDNNHATTKNSSLSNEKENEIIKNKQASLVKDNQKSLNELQKNAAKMLSTSSNLGKKPAMLPQALLYECGNCLHQALFKRTDTISCPKCKYKIVWKTVEPNSYRFITTD